MILPYMLNLLMNIVNICPYIVDDMLMGDSGILDSDLIERSDSVYKQWQEGTISLQEYSTYAASQSWIDISKISDEKTYLNSTEVYRALATYISENLLLDTTFSKRLYHYMLMDDQISGKEVCQLLYDQGLLTQDDDLYKQFDAGTLSAYDLLYKKIESLEITPAQLALDPCSGSIVITDPGHRCSIKKALEVIENHYADCITLEDLAQAAGMNSKYFCRYFKDMTHRTPVDYLNYYRIEQACFKLVTSNESIADIGLSCGFNDVSYFIKTFKKYKGMTPKKYLRAPL